MRNCRRKQTFLGSARIGLPLCNSLDLGFFAARERDSLKLEVMLPAAMTFPDLFPTAAESRGTDGAKEEIRSQPRRFCKHFNSVLCFKIVSSVYDRGVAPMDSQQFGCLNKTNRMIILVDMPTGAGEVPHGPTSRQRVTSSR